MTGTATEAEYSLTELGLRAYFGRHVGLGEGYKASVR